MRLALSAAFFLATTSPIIIPIETPGIRNLQKLERRMLAVEKTVSRVQGTLPKATNNVVRFGRASANASNGVRKLVSMLGELAAFAGVGIGIGAIFQGLEKTDKANAALRTLGADTVTFRKELTALRKELNNNVSELDLTQQAFNVMQAGFKDAADVTQIEAAVKSSQAKPIETGLSQSIDICHQCIWLGCSRCCRFKRKILPDDC